MVAYMGDGTTGTSHPTRYRIGACSVSTGTSNPCFHTRGKNDTSWPENIILLPPAATAPPIPFPKYNWPIKFREKKLRKPKQITFVLCSVGIPRRRYKSSMWARVKKRNE